MAWNPNPRRRRHHKHNRHRRHRRNPDMGGITSLVRHPGTLLADGVFTGLGAYWTISVPNMLLPNLFVGSDLFSSLGRAAVRGLAGGLLYTGARRFAPSYASSVLSGSMLAAGFGFLGSVLGWSVIVGQGDTAQRDLLPGPLAVPGLAGYGAYTRPQLGAYRYNHGRLGAYTRPQLGAYTRTLGAFNRQGALMPKGGFAGFYGGGAGFYG